MHHNSNKTTLDTAVDLCWGLATLCSQYKVLETLITTVFMSGEKPSVSLTLGKKVTQEDIQLTNVFLKDTFIHLCFHFMNVLRLQTYFYQRGK